MPGSTTFFIELVRFTTNYACNKPLRKESHHMFSVTQGVDEFVVAYMKRFREEKIEIFDCLDSIAMQVFRKGF